MKPIKLKRMFNKAITFLIFAVIVYCCVGCSSGYYLRRMAANREKAIKHGAIVDRDTIWKVLKFHIPGVNFHATVRPLNALDTLWFRSVPDKNGYVATTKIKIKLKKGCDSTCIETVYVSNDCPEHDAEVKTPIAINETIKKPPKNNWLKFFVIGLLVGMALMGYVMKAHPTITIRNNKE